MAKQIVYGDQAFETAIPRARPRSRRVDQGAVVLFDGTCAFCEGVKFIATRDPQGYFRFGASQTDKATALLALYGMTRQAARSLILIEHGQIYLRSTASLRIARRLRWPWSLWAVSSSSLARFAILCTASSPRFAIGSRAGRMRARFRRRRFARG